VGFDMDLAVPHGGIASEQVMVCVTCI
jgi:hypothetical protein